MRAIAPIMSKVRLWLATLAWLGLAVPLALTACTTVPGPMSAGPAPEAYKVGPGDRLQVMVFGEKDLTGEFQVDDTGSVAFPLVGAFAVKDMTPRQVETGLAQQLRRGGLVTDPKVNVSVVRYRPIFVIGEVQKPGPYEFYNGITVLNAVAYAGGYTYRARNSQIKVVRAESTDRKPELVNEASLLQPGDIIVVPERWF